MFFSSELTAVNTEMTQKIPIVIPVSERNERSLDDLSSSNESLRLWVNILKMIFTQRSYAKALISAIGFSYRDLNCYSFTILNVCDWSAVLSFRKYIPAFSMAGLRITLLPDVIPLSVYITLPDTSVI